MKARRGGLSLGAGFRVAQKERKSQLERRSAMDVMGTEVLRSSDDQSHRCPPSPERDEFDEGDLDVRTQMLLNKFLSCPIPSRENTVKAESASGRSQSPVNPLKRKAESISRDTPIPEPMPQTNTSQIDTLGSSGLVEPVPSTVQNGSSKSNEVFPASTPQAIGTGGNSFGEQHVIVIESDSTASSDINVISSRKISRTLPDSFLSPTKSIQPSKKSLKKKPTEKKFSKVPKQARLSYAGASSIERNQKRGLPTQGLKDSSKRKSVNKEPTRTNPSSSNIKASKKKNGIFKSFFPPTSDVKGNTHPKRVVDLPSRPHSVKSPGKSSEASVANHSLPLSGGASGVNIETPSVSQPITTHSEKPSTKPIKTQTAPEDLVKASKSSSERNSSGSCILSIPGEKLAQMIDPLKIATPKAPQIVKEPSEPSQPSISTSGFVNSKPNEKSKPLYPQVSGQKSASKKSNEAPESNHSLLSSGSALGTNLNVPSDTHSNTSYSKKPSTEPLTVQKSPEVQKESKSPSTLRINAKAQSNNFSEGSDNNFQAPPSSSASTMKHSGTSMPAHLTSSDKVLSGQGEQQIQIFTLRYASSSELGATNNKPDECSKQPAFSNHATQSNINESRNVPPPIANVSNHYNNNNTQGVNIGRNAVTSTKKNKAPPALSIAPRNDSEKTHSRPGVEEDFLEPQQTSSFSSSFSTSETGAQNTSIRQTDVRMPAKLDSSSGQESPIRRSRRSRNAPTNYYARPASYRGLHAIIDEFDAEESESPPHSPVEPESPPNKVAQQKATLQHKVVYQSRDYHITCESLISRTTSSLVEGIGESNATYLNQDRRQRLGDFAGRSGVIHIDYDIDELNAIYGLLTGNSATRDDDVSILGLVSQAAILYRHKGGDFDELAHRVRYLRALGRQLTGQAKDVTDFLVDLKNGAAGDYNMKAKKIEKISRYLLKIFNIRRGKCHTYSLDYLKKILKELKTDWLLKLGAQYHHADALARREPDDIRNFLKDAYDETLNASPCLLRIVSGVSNYHLRSAEDTSTLLRSRELGYTTHQNRSRINRRLCEKRKLESWKTWTGASNDVLVLSWSPDSTRFVAGAAAQTDEHHMQYNRGNNLLLGDLSNNKLRELPDHRIKRPLLESGPNSRRTYVMVDPDLYMTVNAVHWTSCGSRVYTSSFDHTVKLWEVSNFETTRCIKTLKHPGRVQEMAVSTFNSDLVATGSDGPNFSLWQVNDIDPEPISLCFPEDKCTEMIPSSLQWGKTAHTNRFLAGGMTREDPSDSCDPSRHGYLALWLLGEAAVTPLPNLHCNTQNIFDIAWHPNLSILATGCTVPSSARSSGFGKDVRSLVRIYDPVNGRSITEMYQCPALDINQVTFCPANENYITASCTDGVTYVWDYRNSGQILHKLKHGQPIGAIEHGQTREQVDVGVRCSLWGRGTDLFTGASDGVLKRWDVRLSPEDVLQEDVASFNQELMSASMSPDYTNIVLGDSSGGIHVISTAPWGRSDDNFATFELERAIAPNLNEQIEEDSVGGVKEAADLISSGKLVVHPVFGPGQGPNYNGPYARWARPNTSQDKLPFTPLDPTVQAIQLDGPAPSKRRGLDMKTQEEIARKIQLSTIRNRNRFKNKRKREIGSSPHPRRSVSFQAPTTPNSARARDVSASFTFTAATSVQSRLPVTPSKSFPLQSTQELPFKIDTKNFVDLTLDTDEEDAVHEIISPSFDEQEDNEFQEDHWWPVNVDANLKGINHDNN